MPKTFELFSFPVSGCGGWWLSLDNLFRISNISNLYIFSHRGLTTIACISDSYIAFSFISEFSQFSSKWTTNSKLLCSKFHIFEHFDVLIIIGHSTHFRLCRKFKGLSFQMQWPINFGFSVWWLHDVQSSRLKYSSKNSTN